MISPGVDQRQRGLHAVEKVVPERAMFGETEMGISLDQFERFAPGDREKFLVGYQVCDLKFRQSALPGSEKIPWTPHFQVNFSNSKPIMRLEHGTQPPDCFLFLILIAIEIGG